MEERSTGWRRDEYVLTPNAAKRLCLASGTPKGNQVQNYFRMEILVKEFISEHGDVEAIVGQRCALRGGCPCIIFGAYLSNALRRACADGSTAPLVVEVGSWKGIGTRKENLLRLLTSTPGCDSIFLLH